MINTKRYNYDFSRLEDALGLLITSRSLSVLNKIKDELNRFFKESSCEEIVYTLNTDKLFFGMSVCPIIDANDVQKILFDDSPYMIKKYYIEIDSKLLDMDLTQGELLAVLLHEVGHIVNDSSPTKDVRRAVDEYLVKHRESLSLKESMHFKELLAYGLKNAYRKASSIFTRGNDEILADEFVFMCGYGEQLQSAFEKICSRTDVIYRGVDNDFIILYWSIYLYKNIKTQRYSAIKTLNRCKRLTASKLEKRDIEIALQSLEKIDDFAMQENAYFYNALTESNGLVGKVRRKGLRGLEEDIYEFEMRIKNVEEEDDALLLMRQINTRIAVLDDYIYTNPEEDNSHWLKVMDRYQQLREQLAKKTTYSRKNYGIWTDYNTLGVGDMYR